MRPLLLACCCFLALAPARSQSNFTPGTVTEKVTCETARKQHYAVYLPSAYTPARTWPVLFVMDPRGNALAPLRRLQAAAEQYGYLILSSYNTLSDGPVQPNVDAINAMVDDVRRRFSPDESRFYLVGFSGTARLAWRFGYQMPNQVAGILGFGAAWTPQFDAAFWTQQVGHPFVFFGGSGILDFNFEEMHQLDAAMDRYDYTHRLMFYPGPHAWPPDAVFTQGIEWMELQAAQRAGRNLEPDLLHAMMARRMQTAEGHVQDEDWWLALEAYRGIVEDFEGLVSTTPAQIKLEELQKDKTVRKAVKDRNKWANEHFAYRDRLYEVLEEFKTKDRLPSPKSLKKKLRLNKLQKQAAVTENRGAMLAARRILATVFGRLSFYEPQTYLAKEDYPRALLLLQIAKEIQPQNPSVCYNLAQAYAHLEQPDEALKALACFKSSRFADLEKLRVDPNLRPLHTHPRFQEMVAE